VAVKPRIDYSLKENGSKMVDKEGKSLVGNLRGGLRQESYDFVTRQIAESKVGTQDTDFAGALPLTKNRVVISEWNPKPTSKGQFYLYDIEKDKVVWRKDGVFRPAESAHYDDVNDRILIGCQEGIRVLDASDGEILYSRYPLAGKKAFQCYTCWDLSDEDLETVIVTSADLHVAYKYNFVTDTILDTFGEIGTSGSDLSHLSTPAQPDVNTYDDTLYLPDKGNHRILRIQLSDFSNVKDLMLFPWVRGYRRMRYGVTQQRYLPDLIMNAGVPSAPTLTIGANRGRNLLWNIPFQLELPQWSPHLQYVWGAHLLLTEISMSRLIGTYRGRQRGLTLLNNETVDTGGWQSYPVPGMLMGDLSFTLYSSENGTVKIQVPDENAGSVSEGLESLWVPTGYSWRDWDTADITGGSYFTYNFTFQPPCFRIQFTPSASATVTLRLGDRGFS